MNDPYLPYMELEDMRDACYSDPSDERIRSYLGALHGQMASAITITEIESFKARHKGDISLACQTCD